MNVLLLERIVKEFGQLFINFQGEVEDREFHVATHPMAKRYGFGHTLEEALINLQEKLDDEREIGDEN